jgi:TetR/AcrR family transcriptional regulator, transcriptional repressor for nem operon
MGRARDFSVEAVTASVREVFWDRGYERTSISDIEASTAVNRSSLYLVFGSKEGLFEKAIDSYIVGVMRPEIDRMMRPGAGIPAIGRFFGHWAELLRADGASARRGCMWVNAIAEFSGRVARPDSRAAEYATRLHDGFANALTTSSLQQGMRRSVDRRARALVAATFGMWTTVRIDAESAALMCDALAWEVRLQAHPPSSGPA